MFTNIFLFAIQSFKTNFQILKQGLKILNWSLNYVAECICFITVMSSCTVTVQLRSLHVCVALDNIAQFIIICLFHTLLTQSFVSDYTANNIIGTFSEKLLL